MPHTFKLLLLWTIFIVFAILALSYGARAQMPHDLADSNHWYPWECCSGLDCAPVTESKVVGLHWFVTTAHGTVEVPPDAIRRESKDHRLHACMRLLDPSDPKRGMKFLCIFTPPGG